ncbi:LysR family transcriptional regulator [Hoeflea sp.]|uniref:LysR family transcriptional regulator n=1 Tax=Hoeflea sp. TaxID=1940281 RepID=UPI00199F7AB0|nr:LysR family transcriptional regulator [Hoeflea sp.]MBC7282925.1 LysR family transcriptional regulator [Hoeflea sp.]
MDEVRDLRLFLAAARHGGFRGAARATSVPASTVSEAVRRLEDRLGTRLMNRTTRSVALTAAGTELMSRVVPLLDGLDSAFDAVAGFGRGPSGTLRLNVPGAVTRTILPPIATQFLRAYPEVSLDITVDDGLVDILSLGADAGIRYGETLAQDAIAVPIGPRLQRAAAAASPDYLARHGTPGHPRDLLAHACIRTRFPGGALTEWTFEKNDESVTVEPTGPLTISTQAAEFAIGTAIDGLGIVATFEDWLRPAMDDGRLVPVLEDWWPIFEGPFLYYSSRRHMPPPLRAFVDFIKALPRDAGV